MLNFLGRYPVRHPLTHLNRRLFQHLFFFIQISGCLFICMSTSQTGIGLPLGQIVDGKEVAIAYAGRDLNPADSNYSATEHEALAVINGMKQFQSYLQNTKFTIHTDHNALKWLMSLDDPCGRLARWTMLIQQLDFNIVHWLGTANGYADSLLEGLMAAAV